MNLIALLISILISIQPVFAAGSGEVLDFEGDVIEGEKKAPELYLQLDVETSDLSFVLYDRKNFNDFHGIDRNKRPKLATPVQRRK